MKKGRKTLQYEKNKKGGIVFLSFKGSAFIVLSILVSTFVIPVLLESLGLQLLPLRVLLIAVTTAFSTCYALFFIDSDRGYTKSFWAAFVFLSIISGLIAYYWVYGIYFV